MDKRCMKFSSISTVDRVFVRLDPSRDTFTNNSDLGLDGYIEFCDEGFNLRFFEGLKALNGCGENLDDRTPVPSYEIIPDWTLLGNKARACNPAEYDVVCAVNTGIYNMTISDNIVLIPPLFSSQQMFARVGESSYHNLPLTVPMKRFKKDLQQFLRILDKGVVDEDVSDNILLKPCTDIEELCSTLKFYLSDDFDDDTTTDLKRSSILDTLISKGKIVEISCSSEAVSVTCYEGELMTLKKPN